MLFSTDLAFLISLACFMSFPVETDIQDRFKPAPEIGETGMLAKRKRGFAVRIDLLNASMEYFGARSKLTDRDLLGMQMQS
jgi:hypothetical protein